MSSSYCSRYSFAVMMVLEGEFESLKRVLIISQWRINCSWTSHKDHHLVSEWVVFDSPVNFRNLFFSFKENAKIEFHSIVNFSSSGATNSLPALSTVWDKQ
eukprot:Pompholyxophrys_punicea_v1_NODE_567_length_1677_cov_3.164612.p2 type:complete len:101 gc:universal NODE_567_length_1677_cov_3.164612:1279-977(-)